MKDILLITPPFTQLNTPYPATAYIKGFLNKLGVSSFQSDLGIEVILKIYSSDGLNKVFEYAHNRGTILSQNDRRIFALRDDYINTVDQVIQFLQGQNPTLARLICSQNFLPEASRFEQLSDLEWAFGNMGMQDQAKHLATIYLEDISDFIVSCVDEHFGFSRYAERLGRSANTFDELHDVLQAENRFIDDIAIEILSNLLIKKQPKLVCFSVPFPGNLYSAFRNAKYIKDNYPHIKIAMGGGFANTELRSLNDTRVFQYFDFISLDDGELPLELIWSNIHHPSPDNPDYNLLKRTYQFVDGAILYNNFSLRKDYQQKDTGTPDYSDLPLKKYISVIEMANPMHSIWSDGRWNKLTMAHGCYWGKCTFCDVSLDYIKNYQPVAAKLLVDRMEELIAQTQETGFHFVDEAAPPSLMRDLAIEILRRKLVVTWWTNIRFEKSFSRDLCLLLKASGCIAVSGGLEVASDRLLKLIQKGVTVEQVARVTSNFTEAGIMVHAYLMYGYPTQTVQETVDSLEMVKQLFEQGVIQSGFWHQFALTAHSPIGIDPESYGILPEYQEIQFADNDIQFKDKTGINHDKFSFGLKKSLFNYMHRMCFDFPLQDWFDFKIPRTTIHKDFISNCLDVDAPTIPKDTAKIFWLGSQPLSRPWTKEKKGRTIEMLELQCHSKNSFCTVSFEKEIGEWILHKILELISIPESLDTVNDWREDFRKNFESFDMFWFSKEMDVLRDHALMVL